MIKAACEPIRSATSTGQNNTNTLKCPVYGRCSLKIKMCRSQSIRRETSKQKVQTA